MRGLTMSPRDEISVERRARADRLPRQGRRARAARNGRPDEPKPTRLRCSRPTGCGRTPPPGSPSHSLQILLGLAAGTVIVVAADGRALARRAHLPHRSRPHLHWRTVLGRVLARTRLWFMVALAARLVAEHRPAARAVVARRSQSLFIVAMTLQAALWARELVLGVIEHRAGGIERFERPRQRDRHHPPAGQHRHLRDRDRSSCSTISGSTSPASSPGSASAASPSASPRRAFSTTCSRRSRSSSTSRSAAATRSGSDTTSGTVEQIGLKSTRVRADTGEEVVVSNANLLEQGAAQFRADRAPAGTDALRPHLPDRPEVVRPVPEMIRAIVEAAQSARNLSAAPFWPSRTSSLTSS